MSALRPPVFVSLAVLAAVVACVTNPVTGKKEFSLLSDEEAAELGRRAAEETIASVGLVDDPKMAAYVDAVGQRLARKSELPAARWEFKVLDDPAVNAFALPGGHVFVTRGILARMSSEAELASVLGHEIGHVTARHSASQISQQELAGLGLGLGSVLLPGVGRFAGLAQLGLGLLFLKYGRDAERQADELGFRYAESAGYDPRAAVELFQMLSREGGRSGRLPEWLATHPNPEHRLESTRERIAKSGRNYEGLELGRVAYLASLEGLPYGPDPRQGYFMGSRFVQPKLGFQVEFPPGWKTVNEPRLVGAVSPDQAAAVVVTVAGEGEPMALAQRFLAQEGVQGSAPVSGPIGGLPAAATQFTARTEQGRVEGFASFVAYEGKTYRLLGYTPAGRLAAFDPALRASLGSFRPLTNPEERQVRPPRLEIRTLEAPMTLVEFQRRWPSAVSIDELAVLNGVQPMAAIPAGRQVKRVVPGTGIPAAGAPGGGDRSGGSSREAEALARGTARPRGGRNADAAADGGGPSGAAPGGDRQ
jgi:predicted Zn-dependent protease